MPFQNSEFYFGLYLMSWRRSFQHPSCFVRIWCITKEDRVDTSEILRILWHMYFKIIRPKSRDGWYWLTYRQIKYHGSRFMFDLCHNQSYERTGSDALTLKIYSHLCRKCGGEKNYIQIMLRIKKIYVFEGENCDGETGSDR